MEKRTIQGCLGPAIKTTSPKQARGQELPRKRNGKGSNVNFASQQPNRDGATVWIWSRKNSFSTFSTSSLVLVGFAFGRKSLLAGNRFWRKVALGGKLLLVGSCFWREVAFGGKLLLVGSRFWRKVTFGGKPLLAGSRFWREIAFGRELLLAGC